MGEQKLVYFAMLKLRSSHLRSLKDFFLSQWLSTCQKSKYLHIYLTSALRYKRLYTRMFPKQKHPKHWTWLALKPYIFFFKCSLAPQKYRNFNQNNQSALSNNKIKSRSQYGAYNILIKYFRIINNLFRLLQWKKLTKMFSQGIVNQSWTFDRWTQKRE